MANSVMQRLACVVLLCMVVSAPYAAECESYCSMVANKLAPCISFLRRGGTVPSLCCAGVKELDFVAHSTSDRQNACKCFKSIVSGVGGINPAYASLLPGKCGVNIPYISSPSTDCATVKGGVTGPAGLEEEERSLAS